MPVWSRAILIGVLTALAVITVPSAVLQYSLQRPVDLNDLLAYWQAAAAFVAVGLASGLGYYSVSQVRLAQKQVNLAQQALEDSQRSRGEDQAASVRSILWSLYQELNVNRIEALRREGRYKIDSGSAVRWGESFVCERYDEAARGPLWGLPAHALSVQPIVTQAYEEIRILNARVRPLDWEELIGAGVVSALQPSGRRMLSLLIFGPYFLNKVIRRQWQLSRSGEFARTRAVIEKAMEAIYREIYDTPLSWAELDRESPPGLKPVRGRLPNMSSN